MFQRRLHIYLLLVSSITLNLLQVSAMPAIKSRQVLGKNFPQPVLEFAPEVSVVPPPPVPLPDPAGEKYEIDVVMDYERHSLTVEETITYPNRTGTVLDSLTLAVAPNLTPDCFELTRLSIGNVSTDYNLNYHRLEVALPTPLEPDSTVQLTLRYNLSLPYLDQFNTIYSRVFGYTDVQTNLINWYPFVVPFVDGEWVLHEPWLYGDYLVYPVVDYKVNLLFIGDGDAPVVASSGSAEQIEAFTRYTLEDGRAFAFSISPNFKVSSMKVGGTTISSYYLPGYRNQAEAAMEASAQAVGLFSELFGEYPRSTLSIVQADLSDSREFSGLSFISRNFYQLYDGTSKNYLTFASIHTTAHQWWFDGVGNDQAVEPWLDESLATYSELLYFENIQPELLPYWQENRVDFFRPQGRIDISIYDGLNYDSYKQAAYFNGVTFLQDLRERIGEYAFHNFLRDYYQQADGSIVSQDDFFRILNEHSRADISDIIAKYFE
jgi:hypothetical protein